MKYSRYLEAFYRGYSRHTTRGRDNVQFRYHGDYRIIFWSYNNRVIAIVVSQEYNGSRYLLLRAPEAKNKSKKAISGRIGSILARFSLYQENLDWKNGALLFYVPGHNRRTNNSINSIAQRINQIWND
jgi:hypothetical protein